MARIAIFDTRYSPKMMDVRTISAGESVIIHKEDCYFIKAIDELHIIEVQISDELIKEDIDIFDWDWR